MRNVPAAADAALGADLFQILTEDAADTVFSPASVASALRIALCGARGQTAAELARVLHLDEDPKPQDAAADRTTANADIRRQRQRVRDVPGAEHRVDPVRAPGAALRSRPGCTTR